MYPLLLALHSFIRWLVLISLLTGIVRGYNGWLGKKKFSRTDNRLRFLTATVAHIQLLLGLWLYIISPITNYFLHNFKTAVHERQIRFFGMEHSVMMMLAVVVITIGATKAKREAQDASKFKKMAIWFTIALLMILSSIPWSFSPLVSRPLLRLF
jgi:H+/gluconate symporter-like permease